MGNAFVPPVVQDPDQNLYNEENGSSTLVTGSAIAGNVITYNSTNQTFAGLQALGYLYQYMAVRYATDANGGGFSSSPTNATYYALRNSASSNISSSPADYSYYLTTGFGTTNFLFYQTNGGRQIQFFIGALAPGATWVQVPTTAIDLDVLTSSSGQNGTSSFPLSIYFQGTSAPTTPTGGTFTLGSYVLVPPSGWTQTFPSPISIGNTVYVSQATIVTTNTTGTITPVWNTPVTAYSAAGATGANGVSGIVLNQTYSNGQVFSQSSNNGAWTPVPVNNFITSTDKITVYRAGRCDWPNRAHHHF